MTRRGRVTPIVTPIVALTLGASLVLGACGDDDSGREARGGAEETPERDGDSATTAAPSGTGSVPAAGSAFCEAAVDARNLLGDLQASVMEDASRAPEAYATAHETLSAVDPPPEIAGDWATITDFIGTLAGALQTVDSSDPAAVGAVFGTAEMQADAAAATAASDRVDRYLTEECDADIPATG